MNTDQAKQTFKDLTQFWEERNVGAEDLCSMCIYSILSCVCQDMDKADKYKERFIMKFELIYNEYMEHKKKNATKPDS